MNNVLYCCCYDDQNYIVRNFFINMFEDDELERYKYVIKCICKYPVDLLEDRIIIRAKLYTYVIYIVKHEINRDDITSIEVIRNGVSRRPGMDNLIDTIRFMEREFKSDYDTFIDMFSWDGMIARVIIFDIELPIASHIKTRNIRYVDPLATYEIDENEKLRFNQQPDYSEFKLGFENI